MRISDWSSDVCSSDLRDITGGLPRVAELFEARKPKDNAIIARVSGRVEFGKDYKAKRRIILRPEDPSQEPIEYLVPKGKHMTVQEGDFIQRGDYLIDGNLDPHDRSEEHTSELQSLMRISYAVFCLKKKSNQDTHKNMTSKIQHTRRLSNVHIAK